MVNRRSSVLPRCRHASPRAALRGEGRGKEAASQGAEELVLTVMVVPPAAPAEDRQDSHGGHGPSERQGPPEHREPSERHDRSEHREPFGPPVYWPYPQNCSWQGGSWEYRGPFLGAEGNCYGPCIIVCPVDWPAV
jgi:hypothetical protein